MPFWWSGRGHRSPDFIRAAIQQGRWIGVVGSAVPRLRGEAVRRLRRKEDVAGLRGVAVVVDRGAGVGLEGVRERHGYILQTTTTDS